MTTEKINCPICKQPLAANAIDVKTLLKGATTVELKYELQWHCKLCNVTITQEKGKQVALE